MRQSQKQQKPSTHQTLLHEYLTLKPHRAVERILTQNDLPYCIQLYNLLQQNVKNNTNQLRSVLYSKHQSLHQCSQTIEKIQQFASKVKNIQQQIDSCLKAPFVEDDWQLSIRTELSPLQKVEKLMNNNEFSKALKECKAGLKVYQERSLLESDPDAYYMNFVKVQIIEKLQEYLKIVPLRSQVIQQAIVTVKQFMDMSSLESLIEYIQQNIGAVSEVAINSRFAQKENNSILQLLYEAVSECSNRSESYPLSQDQVIQVIFKFKLLSIKQTPILEGHQNPEHRISHLYQKVFNYFSDLLQILNQVDKKYIKHKNQADTQHTCDKRIRLYKIFTFNIQKAVNHISELFITHQNDDMGNSSTALTFESELYEKLLESKEFLETLGSLSQHFRKISGLQQDHREEEIDLTGVIKNLWRDFYHQMLDIITDKINPLKWYEISQQAELPEELAVFSVTQYQKLTLQKLVKYKNELKTFKLNFSQLLHKSKTVQQKRSIVGQFLRLKVNIDSAFIIQVNKIRDSIKELKQSRNRKSKKKAEHDVRELLLLYFIVQSYNLSWTDEKEGSLPQIIKQIDKDIFNSQKLSFLLFDQIDQQSLIYQIIDCYLNREIQRQRVSEPEYIQKWQQQVDRLFGPYCSSIPNQQTINDYLKHLILALIKTKLNSLQSK